MKYFYKPMLRPAHTASLPRGLTWDFAEAPAYVNRPDLPRSSHRYGVIVTYRELTVSERKNFDLDQVWL